MENNVQAKVMLFNVASLENVEHITAWNKQCHISATLTEATQVIKSPYVR